MDDTTILLIVGGVVAYSVLKNDLFKPEGFSSPVGLQNANARSGIPDYVSSPSFGGQPATYANVGNTTYKILDSDLPSTGFIKRRAALVSMLPSFLQTDMLKNWVYS